MHARNLSQTLTNKVCKPIGRLKLWLASETKSKLELTPSDETYPYWYLNGKSLSAQLMQETETDVRTLHLSAMPHDAVCMVPVSMDDTMHVPELGGELTVMLTEVLALGSLSTAAWKTYVCPATKDEGLMMRRLLRIVKAESMMLEKFESRPDTSDHTTLRFALSTVAVRVMGRVDPKFTVSGG